MAEKKVQLSQAAEQRLFSGILNVDTKQAPELLVISDRAREIARLSLRAMGGDSSSTDMLNGMFLDVTQNLDMGDISGQVPNFEVLNDALNGVEASQQVVPDILRLTALRDDIENGVGLALQRRMNTLNPNDADALRDGLRFARKSDDFSDVDTMLGGGVLEGAAAEVAADIITSSEVVGLIESLNSHLTAEGTIPSRSVGKTIDTQIRRLWSKAGVDNDELAAANQYYAWVLDKSGMTTTMPFANQPANRQPGVNLEPTSAGGQKNRLNPKPFGQVEGQENIIAPSLTSEDVEALAQVESMQGMKDWMVRTLVRMSENPTSFANWWQQSMVEGMAREGQARLGLSDFSNETLELRTFGYAVAAALGMQNVDRNADANSDNYGQFAPPKNMAAELHWDDGGEKYKVLRGDPTIDVFMRKIMANGFDNDTGWQVVRAYSGEKNYETQNNYLKSLLNSPNDEDMKALKASGISEDMAMAKGRVAMAMFEVDWLPEMARVLNERKRSFALGLSDRDVPWLQAFNDEYFQRIAAEGKTQAAKDRNKGLRKYGTFSYSGKMVAVATENGREVKTKLGYDHPRVFRPWEVASGAKQAYRHRPEVIWRMQEVLSPLIDRKLIVGGKCVRMSKQDAADGYLKLGKGMFEMLGGPQALEWDSLVNMDKIVPILANVWGEGANGSKEFGNVVADIFAAKTDAMFFPGYPHNGQKSFNKIAGLDRESGEKEKQIALEGIIGPAASGAHGFAAEMKRVYHIDLLGTHLENGVRVNDYPQFYDAYLRVQMDEPDSKLAWNWYNKALTEVTNKNRIGLVSGGFSVFKIIFGLK